MSEDQGRSKEVRARRRSMGELRRIGVRLRRNDRGQAIVLIALTLVLLLGMAALAIDGGGVLFLRRDAQNAADAAAIAASREDCAEQFDEGTADEIANNADAVLAGIEAASQNGFTTGKNNSNARDVNVVVEVSPSYLPAGAASGSESENFVVVTIYATKPSYFAHLLFKGSLTVMANAISECQPAEFREGAKAIVGFGDQCTNAVNGSGSGWTASGGIGSASGCDFTGGGGGFDLDEGACEDGVSGSTGKFNSPTPEWDPDPSGLDDDPLDDVYVAADWNNTGIIGAAATYDTCVDAEPAAAGNSCWHNIDPSTATVLEGIYYYTASFDFTGSGVKIGPKGATIIVNNTASGEIGLKNFEPCPSGSGANACSTAATIVQPYQISDTALNAYLATLSDSDEISFVKSIYRAKNWLLVHTNYTRTPEENQCDTNAGNAGIALGPFTHDFYGIIYASHSGCTASFSNFTGAFGAVICVAVDFTGSNWELHWDPGVLPPTNARIGISR